MKAQAFTQCILQPLNFSYFSVTISSLTLLAMLATLIYNADRGLDISDESYYILNMLHINLFSPYVLQKSHIANGLFALLNNNLAFYRIIGVIFIFVSCIYLAKHFSNYIKQTLIKDLDKNNILSIYLIMLLASFSYYSNWLITPSYNLYAYVSIILVTGCLFQIVNNYKNIGSSLFSKEYILLAIFMVLVFLAKPSSLVALIPILFIFCLLHKIKIHYIKAFVVISISFFTILTIYTFILDGGLINYLKNLGYASSTFLLMDGGHDLKSVMVDFAFKFPVASYPLLVISLLMLIFASTVSKEIHINNFWLGIFISLPIILLALAQLFLSEASFIDNKYFQYVLRSNFALLLVYAIYLASLFSITNSNFKTNLHVLFVFLIVLFGLSLACSFGTNTGIWIHARKFLVFPLLFIMLMFFYTNKNIANYAINSLSISIAFFMLIGIFNAYQNPYRLNTNIAKQEYKVNILGDIKVDKGLYNYIMSFQNAIATEKPSHLIDMTGASAGANIFTNSECFNMSWLIGGYKGSDEFVYTLLKDSDREKLLSSWILTADNGERSISNNVLERLDINFPEDYIPVSQHYFPFRDEHQTLWKPRNYKN